MFVTLLFFIPQGTTVRQALVTCVLITLLYTSRAIYNMIAVARPFSDMLNFGYGWINVSDQVIVFLQLKPMFDRS